MIGKAIKLIFSILKGLRVTLKNLFRRAVTLQYPSQKDQMKERYRGLVDLRKDKCIVCLQCMKICPTACLKITHEQQENKKVLTSFDYNMELCCFCGLCEQVCPTLAVYLNKIYEIAVFSRQKLYINLLNPDKYNDWLNAGNK